jgi:hypothetical protein
MQTVRLSPISMSEAEDFLAEVWCKLEEHGIATPGIQLKTGSDRMVSLLLSFESPAAAALALGRIESPLNDNVLTIQTTATRLGHQHSH